MSMYVTIYVSMCMYIHAHLYGYVYVPMWVNSCECESGSEYVCVFEYVRERYHV